MAARKEVEFIITARDRTRAALARARRGFGRLAKAAAAAAAIGGGLFAAAARNTLNFATNVDALSQRLLVSAESIQALEFLGSKLGITMEQSALVLQRLGTNAGEAAEGNERMAEAFERLGLTTGTLRELSRTELFLGLADGVKNFEGTADELQATLRRIIDTEGIRLIPLLKQGAEGITEQIVGLQKRNALITDPEIKKAAEQEAEIRLELLVLQREMNRQMLPLLSALTEFLTKGDAESLTPGGFARTAGAVVSGSVANLGAVGERASAGLFGLQQEARDRGITGRVETVLGVIAGNTAETARKVDAGILDLTVIVEDLVDGHELNDVLGGSSIRRTFRISELVSVPSGQLIEAVQDPGIPKIGDAYPTLATLFVLTVNARPDGPNAARVQCNYSVANRSSGGTWNQPYPGAGNDGSDVKQVTSGVREVTTYRDTSNAIMLLNPPASKTTAQSYSTTATRLSPVGSVVFERTETVPGTARMRDYVGKVNSAVTGAYAANTLLFRSFDEQSEDGGRTWNCTYTFDFAATWRHGDVWRDQDGKVPPDGVPQFFDTIEEANFNNLGLDFSDGQAPL